uniref:SRS domain-containing protein n=1 Tax=Neospora caninum (strain Liverpool) TaxID=572307 RepID=F0JB56_NEOCL|nr:SRS domain-containing protein [Neospora caninum Liverpool]CEL71323.1 TPA: SRS domain-containing protein [Neospora caninum Liverpool]
MSSKQVVSTVGSRVVPTHGRMAGALFLVFAVLMSSAVVGSKGEVPGATEKTCNKEAINGGISVAVDSTSRTVSFICDSDMNQVRPAPTTEKVTRCYTKETFTEEKSLVELFGEKSKGTVTKSKEPSQSSTVTLTLEKLPEKTTTIYFTCAAPAGSSNSVALPAPPLQSALHRQGTSSVRDPSEGVIGLAAGLRRLMMLEAAQREALRRSTNSAAASVGQKNQKNEPCVVRVTVPADPTATIPQLARHDEIEPYSISPTRPYQLVTTQIASPPRSLLRSPVHQLTPVCTFPLSAACTVEKKSMALEVTSESKSVSFQCDTNIDTLSPDVASNKIFDESCQEEVLLAENLPSAKLETQDSRYTFTVEELPETAATFCYKCSPSADGEKELSSGEDTNACTARIKVTAANPDSDSAASVTSRSALPGLVCGLGISLLFIPKFL